MSLEDLQRQFDRLGNWTYEVKFNDYPVPSGPEVTASYVFLQIVKRAHAFGDKALPYDIFSAFRKLTEFGYGKSGFSHFLSVIDLKSENGQDYDGLPFIRNLCKIATMSANRDEYELRLDKLDKAYSILYEAFVPTYEDLRLERQIKNRSIRQKIIGKILRQKIHEPYHMGLKSRNPKP